MPELEIQYADYAVWQRQWIEGEILQQQAAYWKTTLAGAPALLELPTDHPRPAQQDFAGGFAELMLDEQLTAGLKDLSRRHGTTLYMTLLAGWAVLLARLSGQQDVVIGTPVANRGRAEIENLIGFFVNTLALRLDLSGSPRSANCSSKPRRRPWPHSSIRISPSSRWSNWPNRCAAWPTVRCFRSCSPGRTQSEARLNFRAGDCSLYGRRPTEWPSSI